MTTILMQNWCDQEMFLLPRCASTTQGIQIITFTVTSERERKDFLVPFQFCPFSFCLGQYQKGK